MRATVKYDQLTGRSLGGKAQEWMSELIERWGDDQVSAALEEVATTSGKLDKLLSRTSAYLAERHLNHRRVAPPEVSAQTMLDVARGQIPEPDRPYIYDLRDLTAEQYTEVLRWKEQEAEVGRR